MSENEVLKGVKCEDCSFTHPIGVACCPACGSEKITEFNSSGKGSIFTYTVSSFVPVGRHKDRAPYVVAVVETEEGMRLSTIIDDADPENVKIGDAVAFAGFEEKTGPLFKVA